MTSALVLSAPAPVSNTVVLEVPAVPAVTSSPVDDDGDDHETNPIDEDEPSS